MNSAVAVRPATTDAEIREARTLMAELAAWDSAETAHLGIDPDLVAEFYYKADDNSFLGDYRPPAGILLLATIDGRVAGCAAYRRLDDEACEMRHMFVRPEFRGHRVGRRLGEELLAAARVAPYRLMRLETATFMAEAHALYRALGFAIRGPYYEFPDEFRDLSVFMERRLDDAESAP